MPTYSYRCAACNHQFELVQRISEDPVKTCPACHAEAASRLINSANFILKGSGWYSDLYSGGSNKKGEGSSASSSGGASKPAESKPASCDGSGGCGACPAPPAASSASSSTSSSSSSSSTSSSGSN